jgi:hypothetical protein
MMRNVMPSWRTWAVGALALEVTFVGCNALDGLDQGYVEVSCVGASCPDGGAGGSGGATSSVSRAASTGTGSFSSTGSVSSTGGGGTGGSAPGDAAPDASCAACNTQIQNATGATCTMGACDYATCSAGYADEDQDRTNGCESTLPTGVPEASSLVLWLRGEDWDGTTWTDRSPGARSATTYFGTVGMGTLNGRRVAVFDGNGDLLISTGFPGWFGLSIMTVYNAPNPNGAIISMGISFNYGNGICGTAAPAGAPGCQFYDILQFDTNLRLQECAESIQDCYQATGQVASGLGWLRMSGVLTPGATPSYRNYKNGVDEGDLAHNKPWPYPAPWNTPRYDTVVGWGLTPAYIFSGSIAEIIIYNTPLSDTSRLALDAYLATKWGI